MAALRVLLVILYIVLAGYTTAVAFEHGMNFMPVLFGQLAAVGWPGQITLDFLIYLTLSALWIAWRHRFSPGGIAMAVLAFFGAALVTLVYVFWATLDARGDVKVLLLGRGRASGSSR